MIGKMFTGLSHTEATGDHAESDCITGRKGKLDCGGFRSKRERSVWLFQRMGSDFEVWMRKGTLSDYICEYL